MVKNIYKFILVSALFTQFSCGSSPSVMVTPEIQKEAITENPKNEEIKVTSILPVAKIVPEKINIYGKSYTDNYSWLKNTNSSSTMDYLKSENSYTKITLEPTEELQRNLEKEISYRTDMSTTSLPEKIGTNYYYTKKDENSDNIMYCRKKGNLNAKEEILFSLNNQFRENNIKIGSFKISPLQTYLAYSIDLNNSGNFTIYIKNLSNGEILKNEIISTSGNFEWTNDNKNIYYAANDKELNPTKIYKHNVMSGTNKLVYSEKDDNFKLSLSKTDSDAFILIKAKSDNTSEVLYLGAKDTRDNFKIFQKRKNGVMYDLEHNGGKFYVLTNSNARNFKLMSANLLEQYRKNSWQVILAENPHQKLQSMQVYKNNIVVLFQENNKDKIKIINLKKQKTDDIDFKDINYSFNLLQHNNFNSNIVDFSYSSLLSPKSVFEYNMDKKSLKTIKRENLRDYNQYNYQSDRTFVRGVNDKNIPIALVYKKGIQKNGPSPLLLEISNDYSFSPERISLLNRGFIIALADIGNNTKAQIINKEYDNDLISCAEYLINNGYTTSDKLSAYAKNKDGLILAQAVNKRPDLFKSVLLDSPVLDLVSDADKLSESLNMSKYSDNYFSTLVSNSPYENIRVENYPNILVNVNSDSNLSDALRYVAKLRGNKKDTNKVVVISNSYKNHLSNDNSVKYAFILNSLGIKN